MHRLFRSAGRLRARHQTGEGGFTLVEVMVAMILLAIGLTGLAQLAGSQLVDTLKSHIRQSAVTYVNQELEGFRSMSYGRVALDPSVTTPWTSPNGMTFTSSTPSAPVYGSPNCALSSTCLSFLKQPQLSIGSNGQTFNFNEYRWVTAPNAFYKTVYVFLQATSGPSFTYWSQTNVSGATNTTPTAINALELDLQAVTSAGAQMTDSSGNNVPLNGFQITVTGTGVNLSDSSADSSWTTTTIPAGSYTCTVSNAGQGWVTYPGGSASSSFPCNDPGQYTVQWQLINCQDPTVDTAGAFNTLTVTLVNSDNQGINNIKIHLSGSTGHQKPVPGDQNTNASGVATFSNVPPGWYTINVGPAGYFASNGSTVCMWNGSNSTNPTSSSLYITAAANSGGQQKATIQVSVQNNNPNGGSDGMEVAAVANDGSGDTYYEQQIMNAGGSAATFNVNVAGGSTYNGSYTVTVYCLGTDGLASDGQATSWSWTTSSPLANNATWIPTINGSPSSLTNPAAYAC